MWRRRGRRRPILVVAQGDVRPRRTDAAEPDVQVSPRHHDACHRRLLREEVPTGTGGGAAGVTIFGQQLHPIWPTVHHLLHELLVLDAAKIDRHLDGARFARVRAGLEAQKRPLEVGEVVVPRHRGQALVDERQRGRPVSALAPVPVTKEGGRSASSRPRRTRGGCPMLSGGTAQTTGA